jgi:hypothetical protein
VNGNPMSSGWYYFKPDAPGAGQVGPVEWAQLAALAQTGALRPGDSVWHQSLSGWVPASQVGGLFQAQAPVAAPPVQAAPPMQAAWSPQPAVPTGADRRRSVLPWLIPVVTLVVVALAFGLYFGLRDKGDERTGGPGTTASPATSLTTATTGSGTTASTVAGEPDTWLVMMYEDADDEILEEDMAFDLNEAELVGSTDQVKIVAQMDRYVGGYSGDGDITSTKRYLITQDVDLYTVRSQELADLGELDMGDGQTLYDFATWAIDKYPAEHYVLVLSDHGGGWTGGWTDDDPSLDSGLTMQEIDDALGAIVNDTGIGSFELVGFDACLMGQLEVMSGVAPHSKYAVGSEETEPVLGWSYAGFLGALTDNPGMTGRELGQAVVETYIGQDTRVTDNQARALLTGGDFTAAAVADELISDTTLATFDLTEVQDLNSAVNDLALALANIDQEEVAQARAYAQSYASVFGDEDPPSFIDLGHFVDLLLQISSDPAVTEAATQVKAALSQTVTSETHGPERPGSNGLTIYFPNSEEYDFTFGGGQIDYPSSVGRFATASLWDDYLTYHYTGAPFDAGLADLAVVTPAKATQTDFTAAVAESAPAADATIVGPGAGQLTIDPITVSASEINQDGTSTLTTKITGSNVAYVYYYVSYYWPDDGSYLTADMGFVEPGSTKEIAGVYYPDWGEGNVIDISYDWEPTVYYMSDGNEANDQFAFFEPTVYGADTATDIYTVRGTYTFLDSGTQVEAEIDFNGDGDMQGVWGFTDSNDGSGTWHEIIPTKGDTFTITEEYLEFDPNPDGEFVDYDGGTMTFGDTPFTMVPYYAYAGDYVLGIGVEDLDGNITWEFANVKVTE